MWFVLSKGFFDCFDAKLPALPYRPVDVPAAYDGAVSAVWAYVCIVLSRACFDVDAIEPWWVPPIVAPGVLAGTAPGGGRYLSVVRDDRDPEVSDGPSFVFDAALLRREPPPTPSPSSLEVL